MSGSSSSSGLCHSKGPSAWRSNASTEPSSGLKKCEHVRDLRAARAPTRGRFEGRDTGFDALSASAAAAAGSSTLDACRPDLAGGFAGIAPATRGADLRVPATRFVCYFSGTRRGFSATSTTTRFVSRARWRITTHDAPSARAPKSYRYVRTHRVPEATRARGSKRDASGLGGAIPTVPRRNAFSRGAAVRPPGRRRGDARAVRTGNERARIFDDERTREGVKLPPRSSAGPSRRDRIDVFGFWLRLRRDGSASLAARSAGAAAFGGERSGGHALHLARAARARGEARACTSRGGSGRRARHAEAARGASSGRAAGIRDGRVRLRGADHGRGEAPPRGRRARGGPCTSAPTIAPGSIFRGF